MVLREWDYTVVHIKCILSINMCREIGGVGDDEINIRRLELIERYILKSNEYLKK